MRSSADIRLAADTVSRNHLAISLDSTGEILVQDIGSSNGTYISGCELEPNQWHQISDHSEINLGANVRVSIAALQEAKVHSEPQSQQLIQLLQGKNKVIIGRGKDCDVKLNDNLASRHHAAVSKAADGRIFIEDLDSSNGTFVDGRLIHSRTLLTKNTTIFIGRHVLGLTIAAADLARECAVRTSGLGLIFKDGKHGLHATDLEIETRSMTAIMGPSGCGKSTLLRWINGDTVPTHGKVEIFGVDLVSGYEYLRSIIGYVPQDDIVHPELTVTQAVRFAARLRLEHLGNAAISRKVDEVLSDLHIAHIKDNLISNISGGQRKRVSIAVELLSAPLILFLDEPTSPLDPQAIEEFLGILRSLAEKGTTVVMVTHKPEDLAFMDKVIFMAEGGHVVYSGPSDEYLQWFGVQRITEVYARLAGRESLKWRDRFINQRQSATSTPTTGVKLKPANANPFLQWIWLTCRYFTAKTNDRLNTLLLLVQAPVVAMLICVIFTQVTPAVPFLLVISMIWFGTNNAAREIVSERPIFKRERMFNLQIVPYLASKLCVLGAFALVQSALFIAVITAGFTLRESDPVWTDPLSSFAWLSMVCISSTAMGLFLSASLDKVDKVMTAVPLVLIPQIMLAGSITSINNWVVELLSYLAISRWANEGLNVIQEKIHINIPVPGPLGKPLNVQDAILVLQENLGDRNAALFGSASGTLPLAAAWVLLLGFVFLTLTFLKLRATSIRGL